MASDVLKSSTSPKWLDAREVLRAVLYGWFTVAIVAAGVVAYEVDLVQHAQAIYQAQMQVTTTESSEADSGNRLAGFAQIANLALPSQSTGSNFKYYVDSLTSRDVADVLAADPKIMHTVFSDQWDEATQTWRPPAPSRMSLLRERIRSYLDLPATPWHAPDGESLLYFMTGGLQVVQDPRKTYMARVSLNFSDRKFAVDFLNQLNRTADNILRQKQLQRTAQNIAYLTKTLSTITIAEHRFAIAQTLSEQEKSAMVAKSDSPFAAEFFERPWASSLPTSPKPFQDVATAGIFGVLLGCVAAVLQWHAFQGIRRWFRGRRGPRGPAAAVPT